MKDSVSATELVRNLASIIDYVRINKVFVTIRKGKQDIDHLGPVSKRGFPIGKLGELMGSIASLTEEEVLALSQGVEETRKHAKIEEDPWAS